MKIFIDSANLAEIREMSAMGLVDGVTTNPSLVAKENTDFKTLIKNICEIVNGPISAEVISLNSEEMVKEARELHKIHKNIVVKIPMTGDGLKAVKILTSENIKTNVTLVFSPLQALLAAKAGATYISPFVGRLDDISHNGMDLVNEIVDIYGNYAFPTEIIVASVRNPLHVVEAAKMGADISTVPYGVLKQFLKHPLTDLGIERFLQDWKKVPKTGE